MRLRDLGAKGILYLRRGQFGPIVRSAIRNLDQFTERTVMREMPVDDAVPSVDADLSYVVEKTNGFKQYFRVTDSGRIKYDPPRSFTSVSFDIVDVRSVESLDVFVRFDTAGGGIVERRVSVENDEFNQRGSIPFEISVGEPATRAELELVDVDPPRVGSSRTGETGDWRSIAADESGPRLSVPHSNAADGAGPPVFLITVDTFRHDYLDAFSDLIDAMGDDAVVPSEPRTQGVCTWPSHASMFTGVHPGTHGSHAAIPNPPMSDDLTTLPEFLERRGYTCSGCAGAISLRPRLGFSRGFHRYCLKEMSWKDRAFDARSNVGQIRDWIRTDVSSGSRSNFYFLHLFDAHYPYFPPLPVSDLDDLDYQLIDRIPNPKEYREYLDLIENDPIAVDEGDLSVMKRYYRQSLSHVESQLIDLVASLKREGMFEESMIVVAGDHGEDFYENGFLYHHSLYDENLRPGLIVKPPARSDIRVPDDPDLIDVFPTVASLLGEEAPEQCVGEPWTAGRGQKPRVTERLLDTYNVSVEIDGRKGIFTYEENNPNRPSEDQISSGPIHEEYYEFVEEGTPSRFQAADFGSETQRTLREHAEEFMRTQRGTTAEEAVTPSREVEARLEELGYK